MTNRLPFDVAQLGIQPGTPPDPCIMVIFGAGGDLTRRELVPSLFELHCKRLLPERFAVIGFSQSHWDTQAFREAMRGAAPAALFHVSMTARRVFDLAADPLRIAHAFHGDPLLGPLARGALGGWRRITCRSEPATSACSSQNHACVALCAIGFHAK